MAYTDDNQRYDKSERPTTWNGAEYGVSPARQAAMEDGEYLLSAAIDMQEWLEAQGYRFDDTCDGEPQ